MLHLKDLIIKRPINFDLIKSESARKIVEKMLDKDPLKRATLKDIISSDWVSNNGAEQFDSLIDVNSRDTLLKDGKIKFGNLNRLMTRQKTFLKRGNMQNHDFSSYIK